MRIFKKLSAQQLHTSELQSNALFIKADELKWSGFCSSSSPSSTASIHTHALLAPVCVHSGFSTHLANRKCEEIQKCEIHEDEAVELLLDMLRRKLTVDRHWV